jgi:DNA-directed RNA polymerase subunit RPC12/RpoP
MKQTRLIFKIFLFVSAICIIIGLASVVNEMLFLNEAISAEGTVIELKEHISQDSENGKSITYKPQIRYSTRDGETETFVASIGSNPPLYNVGDKVKVLYRYKNGQAVDAKIDSFLSVWLVPLILFFIAFVFGIISIIGLCFPGGGKFMAVNYRVELRGKELKYLLKRNKLCPDCSGKLTREKINQDMGVGVIRYDEIDETSYTYGQRYAVKYRYKCNDCGKSFSIEQLA